MAGYGSSGADVPACRDDGDLFQAAADVSAAAPGGGARRRGLVAGACAAAVVVLASAWRGSAAAPLGSASLAAVAAAAAADDDDDHPNAGEAAGVIMAYNAYQLRGDDFAGEGYPFVARGAVVEPHRETVLYAKHLGVAAAHAWTLAGPGGEALLKTQSAERLDGGAAGVQLALRHTFTQLGVHTARLAVSGDAAAARELLATGVPGVHGRSNSSLLTNASSAHKAYERELLSTYVRRNIYTTSRGDRDRFLDSFVNLQAMSDAEAQTWGPDCHPLSYFLSIHLEMAAGRVSDKFHDGMGFLTQHASLTNEFELALQALDPTVTIPYWDYTREGEAVFEADTLAAAWDTELWNDTWFGSSGGPLHTVTTGRFAYQVIGSAGNASLTSNPYGLLRAPWNVNKSPFVSRLHKFCNYSMGYSIWPRCETHWNLTFSASYDAFYDWIWQAGYAPHGPVHYYIGGYTNCGDLLDELEYVAGADSRGAIESFARMMVVLPKQLYRAFMTNSPTCAMDVPQEECHMICTQSMKKPGMVDDFMRVVTEVAEGLSGTGIPVDYKWLQTMNESQAEHLANVFCTTPFSPGEQIEAASPVDVQLHGTVVALLIRDDAAAHYSVARVRARLRERDAAPRRFAAARRRRGRGPGAQGRHPLHAPAALRRELRRGRGAQAPRRRGEAGQAPPVQGGRARAPRAARAGRARAVRARPRGRAARLAPLPLRRPRARGAGAALRLRDHAAPPLRAPRVLVRLLRRLLQGQVPHGAVPRARPGLEDARVLRRAAPQVRGRAAGEDRGRAQRTRGQARDLPPELARVRARRQLRDAHARGRAGNKHMQHDFNTHGFDIRFSSSETNSPRENDPSKHQPKRRRCDRAREVFAGQGAPLVVSGAGSRAARSTTTPCPCRRRRSTPRWNTRRRSTPSWARSSARPSRSACSARSSARASRRPAATSTRGRRRTRRRRTSPRTSSTRSPPTRSSTTRSTRGPTSSSRPTSRASPRARPPRVRVYVHATTARPRPRR